MDYSIKFIPVSISNDSTNDTIVDSTIIQDSFLVGLEFLCNNSINIADINSDIVDYVYSRDIEVASICELEAAKSCCFCSTTKIVVRVSKDIVIESIEYYVDKQKRIQGKINTDKLVQVWRDSKYASLILSDIDKQLLECRQEELRNRAAAIEAKRKIENFKKAEKVAWIELNGSDYLKDCFELNLHGEKNYIKERLAVELPDYTINSDSSGWERRYSPSLEAISELKRVLKLGFDAGLYYIAGDYDTHPVEIIGIRDLWGTSYSATFVVQVLGGR